MDLLGSIMSSMDKPPSSTATEAERKINKERKEQMERWRRQENKRIFAFKSKVRKRIEEFIRDTEIQKLTFEAMTNVDRALVREISEETGLTAFSFGDEEVDRHVVVWKKEAAPGDDELAALRRGETWNKERAESIKRKREEMEVSKKRKKSNMVEPVPKSDYHAKYNHIICLDVGKSAAQDVSANKQYGNVKLENKKDRRTIEETLAERKAKRLQEDVLQGNQHSIITSTKSQRKEHTTQGN